MQAANDTLADADRAAVQIEVDLLLDELEEISTRTAFNGTELLNGGSDIMIQNGAFSGDALSVELPNLAGILDGTIDTDDIAGIESFHDDGLMSLRTEEEDDPSEGPIAIGNHGEITAMLDDIDVALSLISRARANLGANQNRLEHTVSNLQIASENTSAAESRIRDTDMAREMMQLTQANVLQQAATSMLAQANQSPQGVLQLLN